jgi:hypothetical protein
VIDNDVGLWVRYRATHAESIEQRHGEFLRNMAVIGPPLGFLGLALPPAPDCGDNLVASYRIKYPVPGLKFLGMYKFRGERFKYEDQASFDDDVHFGFRTSNKNLNYPSILHEHFPRVIEAFRGYRGAVIVNGYDLAYCGGFQPSDTRGNPIRNNPTYNQLSAEKSIDVDGRNNIYTLHPAQYWDAELCQRALGFGPDEVIARLRGDALHIQRLMDGVYLVLNDAPDLTYEAFVAMNERYKGLLGLP